MRHCLILLLGLLGFSFAQGQSSPQFDSLSDGEVETIVREFSANLVHTTVTPPTSLGKVFGIEASVVAGVTQTPGIDGISKSRDANAELPYIPHAWLITNISVPFGITVEANILPTLDISGIKMGHISAGVKWSITDQFFKNLPFDWAVRTYYSNSEISFSQTATSPNFPGVSSSINVGYNNTMIGADNLVGFDLGIAEPYVGIGFVSSSATLTGRSQSAIPYSIFNDNTSEQKSLTESSIRAIAGIQLALPLLKFSLEYTNVFSIHRLSAKAGFSF